jgi:hypothetical protein
MFYKFIAASALVLGLCPAAFAQSSSGQGSSSAKSEQSLPQEIKQKLSAQGFTNVQVVPGSYLVSAKDKDGDPVTMVIGPNSMAMFTVTQEGAAGGKQGGTTK